MNDNDLDSLHYSNEPEKNYMAYGIFGIFLVASLGSIFLGIYLASFNNDWWIMLFFGTFAIILGFFGYVFYPSEKELVYSYHVTTKGIHQQWVNKKKNKMTENLISFKDVNQVLVGLYAERFSTETKPFYRLYALLIIMLDDGYFFKRFLAAEDLQAWIKQMEGNVPEITYTDKDLQEAFYANTFTPVDFSQMEGSADDIVSEHIGEERHKNILTTWKPEGIDEKVKEIEKKQILPQTRKAEKRTFYILFIYNLLFALFILPHAPLDVDGFIEMTNTIIIAYLGVNLFLPCILVFYRKYTKWYLPLLCVISSFIGNIVGVFVVYLIDSAPLIYESVIALNLFILVLWVFAIIIIKVFKFVANAFIKYDL